jgi:HEAT repeat protein
MGFRECNARRLGLGLTLAMVSLLTPLGAGCSKPTSDNIQLWKTTQKGPDRLKEAVGDRSVTPKLRAEAAAALVDIGRAEEGEAILAGAPAEDRAAIVKVLIPIDEVAMKDPAPDRALAYRDALFSLRQFATPEDQKRIDGTLLPLFEADLKSGRLRVGRHSLDKMLTAVGPEAGTMLAKALSEPIPSYPLAAELLGKVGDETARAAGGAALVARARKEKDSRPAMWKAMAAIGGAAVNKYLEEKAQGANKEDAVSAVRALQERRDPAVLPFALKVAGDGKADKLVRDEMFGVIEAIGGEPARQGLLSIISSDKEEMVRYRAFEVMLAAAKADGVIPALEAFPAGVSYKKVDVDDLLVKLIEKLGPPVRPVLVKALDSRSPLARMTAVMTLEQVGRAEDAPALEKIAKDSTALKGFPAGETIGREASRVAEVVKKKA